MKELRKEVCPAFGKTCKLCSKMNNFAKKCQSTRSQGHRKVNTVNQDECFTEDTSEEEVLLVSLGNDNDQNQINTVNGSSYKTKIHATMEINGKTVDMQVDCGASCNVLPEFLVPVS